VDHEDYDEIEEEYELPALTQAAVALHEIYLSLLDGGFRTDDALKIVARLITEQGFSEEDYPL
jgi:hypothetical protein